MEHSSKKKLKEKAKRCLEKGGQETGSCSPRMKSLEDAQPEEVPSLSIKEKKLESGKIVK